MLCFVTIPIAAAAAVVTPATVPTPAFVAPVPGPSLLTEPSCAAIAPPPPLVASAPSWKQAASLVPGSPEIGFAVPEIPSLPTADKLPAESDLVLLAGEAGSPVASGVIPPAGSAVPGIPGLQALSTSALSAPGVAPAAALPGTITSPQFVPCELPPLPETKTYSSAVAAPVNALRRLRRVGA
jgi:hypothetical protein